MKTHQSIHRHLRLTAGLLAVGLGSFCDAANSAVFPPDDPSTHNGLFIAPYVWAPSFKGSVGFGKLEVPLDFQPQELVGSVKAAAMGYAAYSRDQHFVYVEGLGIRIGDKSFEKFYGLPVKSQLTVTEVGYGQHFDFEPAYPAEGSIVISPYIGLRYANLTFDAGEGRLALSANEHWVDPVLGVVIFGPLLQKLSYVLKIDAAGFGLGKDHYKSGIGALQYIFNERWSIGVGYRASRFNARPGGSNDLTLDLRAAGPEAGLTYAFTY